MTPTLKILRLPDVRAVSGKSRSAIYAAIKDSTWPPQVSLGGTAVGWLEHEVDTVIRARVAGKTDDEMRDLVTELVSLRSRLLADKQAA